MSKVFVDRLLEAIAGKRSVICVGIDPIYDQMPDAVAGPSRLRNLNDPQAALDAVYTFTTGVLKTVAPHVPIVKFQSAYFEKYHWEGVEAYFSLIQEAHELGLLVIGDVKRGDIGSTSAAYAQAHLDPAPFADLEADAPDAITINPLLGIESIEPFVSLAASRARDCSCWCAQAIPARRIFRMRSSPTVERGRSCWPTGSHRSPPIRR